MITYSELEENGELVSSGSSLHGWDEVYSYKDKKYQVFGTTGSTDDVDIIEIK